MQPTSDYALDAPAELTTKVSSLHIAQADITRLRQNGWPLPHKLTANQMWLSLASEQTVQEFALQLRERGFSAAFADLLRWAANDGKCWLLIDDNAELNDRLLIFVG
jgi:hypothetical protein